MVVASRDDLIGTCIGDRAGNTTPSRISGRHIFSQKKISHVRIIPCTRPVHRRQRSSRRCTITLAHLGSFVRNLKVEAPSCKPASYCHGIDELLTNHSMVVLLSLMVSLWSGFHSLQAQVQTTGTHITRTHKTRRSSCEYLRLSRDSAETLRERQLCPRELRRHVLRLTSPALSRCKLSTEHAAPSDLEFRDSMSTQPCMGGATGTNGQKGEYAREMKRR